MDPTGIDGSLVIAGGGKLPDSITQKFIELGGGDKAKLVIVPTAGTDADDPDKHDSILEPWRDLKVESVTLLHTRDRATADSDEFLEPLSAATAVWFTGGSQTRIAEAYVGTKFEQALNTVLERGGVVGGSSAGAAIQSRLMIASGNPVPELKQGFDLLPGAVIDQHFLKRNRQPRLIKALSENAGHFGIGIDEGTAVIVRGRSIQTLGESTATIMLAAGAERPLREFVLKSGGRADLTALRRAARDRTDRTFPPAEVKPVEVVSGSLMIIGGGGMTPLMVRTFINLAGGPDATIAILPVSSAQAQRSGDGMKRFLMSHGARNVTVLPQEKREEVESDDFLDVLVNAGGLWFGGGRQWRFMDAYEGTRAESLMHDVLKRGGVIGGSSAGASIQSEYMVRGNPLGNTDMMAAGYERGLGFLPGAAVDQHFTQRRRHADLHSVIARFPQLLGIGIDETTAIVVRGHTAEVMGHHDVYFIDHQPSLFHDGKDLYPTRVGAGGVFDLLLRRTVRPAMPPLPDDKPRRRKQRSN
jgi:cyanophycinase